MVRDRIRAIQYRGQVNRRVKSIHAEVFRQRSNEELLENILEQVETLNKSLDESNKKMINRLDKILKEMTKEAD
ncbi:hypothetical protein [Clostridium intestinale]|uniref:hypothetical protein n=1 Tax=Clostridium intestinale TaxID=36845 RepID=UPI0028E38CAE|nr:hypothetical protein [Clostridium intestinale]